MDDKNNENEIPIPNYAVGIRILLVDPDVISLQHTTLLLEDFTYQVTSIEAPDEALSIVKEGANEYDLIVAATNMQGIDSLAFFKKLMILSNTPIVSMSYEMDSEYIETLLRQGICHSVKKPLERDEARGLSQFVFRKTNKRAFSEGNSVTNPSYKGKGKGKGKEKEVRKRKRGYEDDEGEVNSSGAQPAGKVRSYGNEMNGKEEERIRWNPELYEKSIKVLNSQKQGQAIGTPCIGKLAQPDNYVLQNRYKINNHSTKPITINGIGNLNQQSQLHVGRYQGCSSSDFGGHVQGTTYAQNYPSNFATFLSLQSQNVLHYYSPYYSTLTTPMCGGTITQPRGFDQWSEIFGPGNPGIGSHRPYCTLAPGYFRSSRGVLNLNERIAQIRREYWAGENAEINGEVLSNNEHIIPMHSDPNLQNRGEQRINASRRAVIQTFNENNPSDDVFLEDILSEFRHYSGDNNLKSLGFNNTYNGP